MFKFQNISKSNINFGKLLLVLIPAFVFSTLNIGLASAAESAGPASTISSTSEQTLTSNDTLALSEIDYFYSETCAYCAEQKKFHEKLLLKYPELVINQYDITKSETAAVLRELAEKHNAQRYSGIVPLTFIGESFIVGFSDAKTTGVEIEKALIYNTPGLLAQAEFCDEDADDVICTLDIDSFLSSGSIVDSGSYTILSQSSKLSKFGINAEQLPLPLLSIILGALDGFNICSLGALMLILSLVLVFKSRKKVILFGGLFILITGITYTLLVFIWFSIFSFIAPLVPLFEIIIAVFGLVGGVIFFRQYLRFRKYGPQCEISGSKFVNNAVKRLQETFKSRQSKLASILAVVAFAFVVTVIEFPCSAVIPVAFAAILVDAGVTFTGQMFYIALFMLFYLLDEIIVFLVAVYTLKLWTGGPKMTQKITLAQALFFLAIAVFYFSRLIF